MSLGVDLIENSMESNENTVNEHIEDVRSRINKKQQAAVTGSSFPIKIGEESYSQVCRAKQLVCIYTSSKTDRPWFALVSKVLDQQISVCWYRKVRNSPSKWELTEESDLIYFGSVMLWDFTQDVADDFKAINVAKDILLEVKKSYKNLDDQFKMREKAVNMTKKLKKDLGPGGVDVGNEVICTEVEDFLSGNTSTSDLGEMGAVEESYTRESVTGWDMMEDESDESLENTDEEGRKRIFEKKLKLVDDDIKKLREDDLRWKNKLLEREKVRDNILNDIMVEEESY